MDNKEILNNLEKIISKEKIKQNEPMKEHTSFKIGGPAEFYIKITSIKELQQILEFAKKEAVIKYVSSFLSCSTYKCFPYSL